MNIIVFLGNILIMRADFLSMIIGAIIAAVFFGSQALLSKETWLGYGDVQVGILMGLLLGWELFLISIIISYLLASFMSIVLLASRKVTRKSKIPFSPFLVTGTFITIFYGEYFLDLYLSTLL